MTQADSVLSTPPTNTPVDPTRRHFLTVAVAAGAVAIAAPATAGLAEPDPIFAAIEKHRAAKIPWDKAVDLRADFPDTAGRAGPA
jgi:hypothetical protein